MTLIGFEEVESGSLRQESLPQGRWVALRTETSHGEVSAINHNLSPFLGIQRGFVSGMFERKTLWNVVVTLVDFPVPNLK